MFDTVEALREAGAEVAVHDPMYSAEEIRGFGWEPYELGREIDVAVLQADHAEYRDLESADLPGVRVIVDGRDVLDRSRFDGVRVISVGRPESEVAR